ncbi:MAG: hypothetical protein GY839_06455, partial [candidate division Zixibacteria bacterium]|nr:hypothetical protein [candidate division Zixibacteria bacterium]
AFSVPGTRRLIATDSDSGYADTSQSIQVNPVAVASFDLNDPGAITAGIPFSLTVSNAQDAYGNNVSGLVDVVVIGATESPNGDFPVINDIVVNDGTGSASQVMVLSGTVRFVGSFGAIADTTSDITVEPGEFSGIVLTDYPDTLLVGQAFNTDPMVTVTDRFGNISTNYLGIVTFSGAEVVPDPDTFEVADAGQVTYSGNDFAFTTAGLRELIITDSDSGYADTSQQIQVNPTTITSFSLDNPGPVTAGVPFPLTVSNAVDQYGNGSSGTVTITVIGSTVSPNGDQPIINDIVVTDGSGSYYQILVLTSTVRLVGTFGAFADTTSSITVDPGAFGSLELTNYPDSLIAGESFPSPANDPVVTAKDLFGNLSTDYDGTVTFSGADSVAASYAFQAGDFGQASFSGNDFTFTGAGWRELIVTDSGNSLTDSSSQIYVGSAIIAAFNLSDPGTVTAGVPFTLTVSGAADQFGNTASGIVSIDSVGQSNAPDGTVPVFNEISVVGGSGNAQQILVRTGSTRIMGEAADSAGIVDTTAIIIVLPGTLGQLNLTIASPQVSGQPLDGLSTITAIDEFGNLKDNFDASADSIVISASTGGPISGGILDQNTDFTSGVADLAALGVTYSGIGGPVVFTATSESGIQGESNPVLFSSIVAENITFSPPQVVSGDTATGTVRIANLGDVAVNITGINIFTGDTNFTPIIFNPTLPESIPGGSNSTFDFGFVVSLGVGDYSMSTGVIGDYSGIQTSDSLLDRDTLTVITQSNIIYNANSLTPDTVSNGEDYALTISVHNNGGAVLNLADSSYLYFTDGSEVYQASLTQNSFVDPGSDADLEFESASIAAAFADGLHPIEFFIYGSDLSGLVVDSLTLSDNILIQNASDIIYNSGPVSPDTVLTGAEIAFSVRVNNSGQATLILDHNQIRIAFGDGTNQYIAPIDTSAGVRVDEITGGSDTTLTFISTVLVSDFISDSYEPIVNITGTQNQRPYTTIIPTDSIWVLIPGEMRMDSLITVSINSPKVNVNQEFIVRGFISNLGNEAVDSVTMLLTSDGNSNFGDSLLYVGTVDSAASAQFDYIVTADSVPLLEAFYCSIDKAVNHLSQSPTPIATPLDNSTVAIIEEEAELWLDTLYLSDDSLSTGQLFTVYTRVSHIGSDSYTGSNQLTLDFGGDAGFDIIDPASQDFIIDQLLSWQVEAPDTERPPTTLTVSFRDPFIDQNDDSTALGVDSILTADVVVTARASITHRASIISPVGATDSVISTNQSLLVTDSLFPIGNVESSFARLILPAGFSSADPLTQQLTGDAIEWQVRAGESETADSLGFSCWSIDSNTGESVSDDTIWIPIEVESKATLSFNSDIVYPPSAVDRVISPGGFFTYEAVVTNIGDASTSSGELTLSFETDGFTAQEPLTRTFTPTDTIEWHITSPDIQILDGTSIAVVISSTPTDLNSGEPVVVLSDSTGLDILLKEELPKLLLRDITPIEGAAVAGQPRDVYSFSLENSTAIATSQVALITFGFQLMSGQSVVNPSNIISASTLFVNGEPITGVLGDSTVSFELDPTIIIDPDSLAEITINITPVQNPSVDAFRVRMESDDITAQVVIGGVAEQFVDVVLPDGDAFVLESLPMATMAEDFLSSTTVNQNPYLASEGDLMIGYNLDNDATIDFTIYNVTGDKVWEYRADAVNGRGNAGQHFDDTAVIWNGRNSSGDRVLSGVYYIIVNNTTSGQNVKLKVAVIW